MGFVCKRTPCTSVWTMMVPSCSLWAWRVTTLGISVDTSAVIEKEEDSSIAESILGVLQERKKSMISHRIQKKIISVYVSHIVLRVILLTKICFFPSRDLSVHRFMERI